MRSLALLALVAGCPSPPTSSPDVDPPMVAEPPGSPAGAAVRYRVSFPDRAQHKVVVEATFEAAGPTVWMMPVWTPGSYLVREYARQVETIGATGTDGLPRAVTKVAKNRWSVDAVGAVQLTWTLHAYEPSVRDNVVDADLAMLNGASTFLVPVDHLSEPLEVELVMPADWPDVETALPPHPDGRAAHWLAPDFDTLVDSPILAGNLTVRSFVSDDVEYRIAVAGVVDRWDADRAAEDVARIAAAQVGFWGGTPYESFRFLHVVGYGRGGLEHRNSTLLMTQEVDAKDPAAWLKYLGLVSHELFHAWNVKRLRPAGLGPFDYEREVLTPSLWVAEGLTAYYDDLMLVRAGLMTETEWMAAMSDTLKDALERPGRAVQPVSQASTDAWIKQYRPDANTRNHTVNYYTKGATVGWLLDAHIREATDDRASLDDVMRLLWARFADADGYTAQDVRAAASEVAGEDLSPQFAAWVDGTEELPIEQAMRWFGFRWAEPPAGEAKGHAGLTVDGQGVVQTVALGSSAWAAGISLGDEILALGAVRVTAATLDAEVARLSPSAEVEVTVARQGRLRRLAWTVGAAPEATWKLESDPRVPSAALVHRRRWWGTPLSAR